MTKVSICLLTFNRADLLPLTLESILNQTYGDFDLIVSDDCSSDKTEEICRFYKERDKRVLYNRNTTNLGMPGNLNKALQLASGEYVANLHDGDVYDKTLVEKWVLALDNHPSAGFVFNGYRSVSAAKTPLIYQEPYPSLIDGKQVLVRLLSAWTSCIFGTVMARRRLYEHLGWFDPRFGNYSDVDMWMRLSMISDVAYVKEPLIELMPRDPTRFYAFVHWQVAFWILGMHVANVRRASEYVPELCSSLKQSYSQRRRKYLVCQMILCLKHCRWDRAGEGLAIWKDSSDQMLRYLGTVFGNKNSLPDWYSKNWWQMVDF